MRSVVAVAELPAESRATFPLFYAGDEYPASALVTLEIRDQPVPRPHRPTKVLPAITGVRVTYGDFPNRTTDIHTAATDMPIADFEPDEHWLRELRFSAFHPPTSWAEYDREGWYWIDPEDGMPKLRVHVTAGLRDNTPAGLRSNADDPFGAQIDVQALCIWTTEQVEVPSIFDVLRASTDTVVENLRRLREG
jgi:hypothetical protein